IFIKMNSFNLPQINELRLQARHYWLGRHGRLSERGVCALALTPEEIEARIDLISYMEQLDMAVRIDPVGNIFGFRPERHGRTDGPFIVTGSHIDTVPTGGIYDGRFGVLGALEAVERMNEEGIQTDFPIAVSAFGYEEGKRFFAMSGSAYACGMMSKEEVLNQ